MCASASLGQPAIGPPFLIERLLQQPRFVETVEPARVGPRAAVRGDFVVLDPLRHADDGGVAHIVCRRLIQTLVGFLNNAGEPGAGLRPAPFAPVREDQLEPLEVEPRFVAVLLQRFAQFRRARRLRQPRKRTNHLRFGVVQVAKLVEVQVLQRGKGHSTLPG